MSWKPDPQPVRYDRARVASLKPLEQAILNLRLPLIRLRKVHSPTTRGWRGYWLLLRSSP